MGLVACSGSSFAQSKKYVGKRTAEISLVGISLYSSGQSVINKYGSPDSIEAVTVGSSAGGSGGGPTGGPAAGGGKGGGGGVNPGGNGASAPGINEGDFINGPLPGFIGDPFGDSTSLRQQGGAPPTPGAFPGAGADGGRNAGGPPLPGVPGGGGGKGGAGGGPGNSTSSTGVQYIRMVYNRPNARYAFILDKYNKVVQIEAIGMNDPKVRTSRGIGFGNTFKELMNRYFEPDSYEISGDAFTVRFLQRGKVAFKFARLDPKKPHVVTGIVVAAGKA